MLKDMLFLSSCCSKFSPEINMKIEMSSILEHLPNCILTKESGNQHSIIMDSTFWEHNIHFMKPDFLLIKVLECQQIQKYNIYELNMVLKKLYDITLNCTVSCQ